MTNNEAMTKLCKQHKEFIKMAKVMANSSTEVDQYAEDFVQDAYLKLLSYPNLASKISVSKSKAKGYMFFTIRSLVVSHYRKKKNLRYIHTLGDLNFSEVYDSIEEKTENGRDYLAKIEAKILPVIKANCEWFDYELFKKYIHSGKTTKELAAETTLGIQTIYRSLRRSKLAIAENLWEDYLDYSNMDYDKIN